MNEQMSAYPTCAYLLLQASLPLVALPSFSCHTLPDHRCPPVFLPQSHTILVQFIMPRNPSIFLFLTATKTYRHFHPLCPLSCLIHLNEGFVLSLRVIALCLFPAFTVRMPENIKNALGVYT